MAVVDGAPCPDAGRLRPAPRPLPENAGAFSALPQGEGSRGSSFAEAGEASRLPAGIARPPCLISAPARHQLLPRHPAQRPALPLREGRKRAALSGRGRGNTGGFGWFVAVAEKARPGAGRSRPAPGPLPENAGAFSALPQEEGSRGELPARAVEVGRPPLANIGETALPIPAPPRHRSQLSQHARAPSPPLAGGPKAHSAFGEGSREHRRLRVVVAVGGGAVRPDAGRLASSIETLPENAEAFSALPQGEGSRGSLGKGQ